MRVCGNSSGDSHVLRDLPSRFALSLLFIVAFQPALTFSASPPSPSLGVSPTSLSFVGSAGGTNPASKAVSISNIGRGTLSWTAHDKASWLTLRPASGRNNGTITVSANLGRLEAGTYNTVVTIQVSGAPSQTKTIPVRLTVSKSKAPTVQVSPTSLGFSAALGGPNPASKTIKISNTSSRTLSWTVKDNAGWLTISPTSGTNSGIVRVSANIRGLAAGTYSATLTITTKGNTNPRTLPVKLTVSRATTQTATLTWAPNRERDLAGYKIYRATASGTYGAPIATVPKTATSYIVKGLENRTTYFFVITAYDVAGNESAYSNEVSKSIF